jgi:hypothetical protein
VFRGFLLNPNFPRRWLTAVAISGLNAAKGPNLTAASVIENFQNALRSKRQSAVRRFRDRRESDVQAQFRWPSHCFAPLTLRPRLAFVVAA